MLILRGVGREVRSIYSVDDKTCLLAGAKQEGPAHNPLVNSPSTPRNSSRSRVESWKDSELLFLRCEDSFSNTRVETGEYLDSVE